MKFLLWLMLVVGIGMGVAILTILVPLSHFNVGYYEGDDVRVVRIMKGKKGWMDEIFILPEDPNVTECVYIDTFLDNRFGEGWSSDKVKMRTDIEALVGLHSDK